MRFYKLSPRDMQWLADRPETAMGLQVVGSANPIDLPMVVGGGQVVFVDAPEEQRGEADDIPFLNHPWLNEGTERGRKEAFEEWRKSKANAKTAAATPPSA